MSADRAAFVSEIYGEANVGPDRIDIKPCVRITDDKLVARIPLYPKLADNGLLAVADVVEAIRQAGWSTAFVRRALPRH